MDEWRSVVILQAKGVYKVTEMIRAELPVCSLYAREWHGNGESGNTDFR